MFLADVINDNTGVSLALLVPLLGSSCAGVFWLANRINKLKSGQEKSHAMLQQIQALSLTREDFREWRDALLERNPSIKVPRLGRRGLEWGPEEDDNTEFLEKDK